MTNTNTAVETNVLNPNHAFLIGTPKKSPYQFFVRTEKRSMVAQAIRELLPVHTGKPDPKKSLVFCYDHPYTGWAGFNLPGTFEIRRKLAGMLFSQGWKMGVAVELKFGGLAPLTNKHDHRGTKELPDNTGGCAGCENKNPENCNPCTMDYKYLFDGRQAPKQMFDRNTVWKKVPAASIAQIAGV